MCRVHADIGDAPGQSRAGGERPHPASKRTLGMRAVPMFLAPVGLLPSMGLLPSVSRVWLLPPVWLLRVWRLWIRHGTKLPELSLKRLRADSRALCQTPAPPHGSGLLRDPRLALKKKPRLGTGAQ